MAKTETKEQQTLLDKAPGQEQKKEETKVPASLTIDEKLAEVRNALHVRKGNVNQHLRATYRTTSDILIEVKPLLKQWRLTLCLGEEMVCVGDRIYVKSTAYVTDLDNKQTVAHTAYAREDETRPGVSQSQCTGAATTYARKYCLQGLFAIDDSEADPDKDENMRGTAQPRTELEVIASINAAQNVQQLMSIYNEHPSYRTSEGIMYALKQRKEALTTNNR